MKTLYSVFAVLGLVGNCLVSCSKDPGTGGGGEPPKKVSITGLSPTKGAPGTLVTITGQQFNALAGNNAIRLGSSAMSVTTSSTTQLTFSIPTGMAAGIYEVWVRVGTDSARAPQNFEVTATGNFVSTDVVPITDAIVNNCFAGVGLQNVHLTYRLAGLWPRWRQFAYFKYS